MKLLQYLILFFAFFFLARLFLRVLLPGLFRSLFGKILNRVGQEAFRQGAFGQGAPGRGPFAQGARGQGRFGQDGFGREYARSTWERTPQDDGKIKISYIPPRKKGRRFTSSKAGDFVEFEEVRRK